MDAYPLVPGYCQANKIIAISPAYLTFAITEIMSSTDIKRRQELFTYALTHLHNDAIYIPLTYETNKALFNAKLKGVGFTQTQYEVPFVKMYFEDK